MAVATIAAERPSANCKICRRPAPHGAKLCMQCKAAVKRARQVPTVISEFLPSAAAGVPFPGHDSTRRRSSDATSTPRAAAPLSSGRWGAYLAIVAFGAAVGATGYLAINEIDQDPIRESVPYDAPVAPVVDRGAVHAAEPAPTPALPIADQEHDAAPIATEQVVTAAPQASPARPPVRLSIRQPARNPAAATESAAVASAGPRTAATGSEPAPRALIESEGAPPGR